MAPGSNSSADIPRIVGIDVGGANLKVSVPSMSSRALDGASDRGTSEPAIENASSIAFPMWKQPSAITAGLKECLHNLKIDPERQPFMVALTMTGELADCFATRREGVETIVDAVCHLAADLQVWVYTVDGHWLSPEMARSRAWDVAASNWHALSQWIASEYIPEVKQGAIIDIGSTTVDIIPISNGQVVTSARTDRERMQLGQLVYTGLERTPVCAIVDRLPFGDSWCPVMAERFADSLDAYLFLRLVQETPDCLNTADGRPRTRDAAAARLCRMIGEDVERVSLDSIAKLAEHIVDCQTDQICQALMRNLSAGVVFCSGHGVPIWERIQLVANKNYEYRILADSIGGDAARAAPALAVASLLERHLSRLDTQNPS